MSLSMNYSGSNTMFQNIVQFVLTPICFVRGSCFLYLFIYTVKPVLRGHLWDKEKMALYYKTGDLLNEVQFT
jgi:hypothetical protein